MWKRAKWDGRELKFSHASSDTMKTFSIELEWREGSQHDWWICQFVWIFSSPYGFKVLFCFIQSLCYFLFLKGNSDCLQFIINEFFFEFCFSFCLNGLMEFGSDFSSILASNWIDLTSMTREQCFVLQWENPDNEAFFTCLVIKQIETRNASCNAPNTFSVFYYRNSSSHLAPPKIVTTT